MRYQMLWPTQRVFAITAVDWSVPIVVRGNETDVALLGLALCEISRFPKRFIHAPERQYAAIGFRIDRKHHGQLHHLITPRGLDLWSSRMELDKDPFLLSRLPLGIEQISLKPHPRLKWDQSPRRWYVCLDTTEATVYRYLCGYQVPCVFNKTLTV